MEIEKQIGKDFDVKLGVKAGKIILTVEFDGADELLDGVKAKLPEWLGPLVELVKLEVDKI